MGYAVREYVEGYWYHIYTRGQRKEPLFFSPEDRIHYLNLLDDKYLYRQVRLHDISIEHHLP